MTERRPALWDRDFPKINIVVFDEHSKEYRLAVPGFDKKDIIITEEDGIVHVKGTRYNGLEPYTYELEEIHNDKWTYTFAPPLNHRVVSAKMSNGILTIRTNFVNHGKTINIE